jgi:hypothetical protein
VLSTEKLRWPGAGACQPWAHELGVIVIVGGAPAAPATAPMAPRDARSAAPIATAPTTAR